MEITNRLDGPMGYVHVEQREDNPLNRDEVVARLRDEWRLRQEAILSLPSDETGLQLDRVYAFWQRVGTSRRAIRFLQPPDFRGVQMMVDASEKAGGAFLLEEDMIIMQRGNAHEQLNGPELTESFVVHEETHAEATLLKLLGVASYNAYSTPEEEMIDVWAEHERAGFIVRSPDGTLQGVLPEEGLGELIRGIYVVEQLDRPEGFAGRLHPDKPGLADKYGYWTRSSESEEPHKAFAQGLIGALIFDHLIGKDPNLFPALLGARHTYEALEEMEGRLNTLVPSLYQDMMAVDMTTKRGQQTAPQLFKKVLALTT